MSGLAKRVQQVCRGGKTGKDAWLRINQCFAVLERDNCCNNCPSHCFSPSPRQLTLMTCNLLGLICCLTERSGLTIDPAYTNGAAYLKTIGIVNPAEVARVLDIAMSKCFQHYTSSCKSRGPATWLRRSCLHAQIPTACFSTTVGSGRGMHR